MACSSFIRARVIEHNNEFRFLFHYENTDIQSSAFVTNPSYYDDSEILADHTWLQ